MFQPLQKPVWFPPVGLVDEIAERALEFQGLAGKGAGGFNSAGVLGPQLNWSSGAEARPV